MNVREKEPIVLGMRQYLRQLRGRTLLSLQVDALPPL